MQSNRRIKEVIDELREQVLFLRELGVEGLDVRLESLSIGSGEFEASEPAVNTYRQSTVPPAEKFIPADISLKIPSRSEPASERKTAPSRLSVLPSLPVVAPATHPLNTRTSGAGRRFPTGQ